jgi:6-phosphofructokinase 2
LAWQAQMADILTLTINPAIDVSTSVARMMPVHKLRCGCTRRDPGGGGINVARVVKRFGADVTAMYAMGGTIGRLLQHLLDREGVSSLPVPISEETRENFTVLEEASRQHYRFVLPGPRLTEPEWRAFLDAFAAQLAREQRTRFVVASGSLPPGVPSDFYGQVARLANQAGAKMIVDTSGPALKEALEAGVYIMKPSLREFSELVSAPLASERDWITACRRLVDSRRSEMVALTMGDQGALLVTSHEVLRGQPVPINPISIVGAGDSFLGAMIWSLACGHPLEHAFRYALAAGSAALLMPGTEMCRREDVERLVGEVKVQPI